MALSQPQTARGNLDSMSETSYVRRMSVADGVRVAVIGLVLVWAYWPTFVVLGESWQNPLYSHGYLIPILAGGLLWWRRDMMPTAPLNPSWWALAFAAVAVAMRLGGAYYYFAWPDRGSILFSAAALAMCFGGWQALRWAWPSILFLFFMFPLPGFIEFNLIQPLQRVSTRASTLALQTLGVFAQADGNVIILSEVEMGVVEACSGLRMMAVFVALTVAAAFVMNRPVWQRVAVVLSSVPIAILCNVIRITATGVVYEFFDRKVGDFVFHDLAGYVMPLMALGFLLLELKFFDLIYAIDADRPSKGESAAAREEIAALA